MVNVQVYVNQDRLNAERDSTMYFAREIGKDPEFRVRYATQPDSEYARDADIVLQRLNPPVSEEFMQGLERYDDGFRLFVNPPIAQRYLGSKRYLRDLMALDLTPSTLISSDPQELGHFMDYIAEKAEVMDKEPAVVYKPLQGYGGNGIRKIPLTRIPFGKRKALEELIHLGFGLSDQGREEIVLQEYIDQIKEYGDKRIHLFGSEPAGVVLRIPKKGSFICNQSSGGEVLKTEMTRQDYEIIEKIKHLLEEKRIFWAGIDVVGPYLMEINGISPGLLYACDEKQGLLGSKKSNVRAGVEQLKSSLALGSSAA